MSKEKITIAESGDGYPYWGLLLPIVEYCLQLGCKLDGRTVEEPFFVPIQRLLKKFDLPDGFVTVEKIYFR